MDKHTTRRTAAATAAAHRDSVLAAAAADRHARSFTEMFSIDAPTAALEIEGSDLTTYLADAAASRRN